MQQFINIQSTETLTNSRAEIINNDFTVMSCSSGTSFPTTNLQVGMLCLRTDLDQLYELKDMTPTWKLIFDLAKTATDKEYVDAQVATKVNASDVVTAAVANKILKLDASGQLPASITGNAATASAVAWPNVTGKPASFIPTVATSSVLGGVMIGSGVSVDANGVISVISKDIGVLSGVISHGGIVPLPIGFTQAQCCWIVSMNTDHTDSWDVYEGGPAYIHYRSVCAADANRVVTAQTYIYELGGWRNGTANYLIIGVK